MQQPIVEIILSELKVPFTPLYLRQIERKMPYGASLWAIGQILNRYGVDHTSIVPMLTSLHHLSKTLLMPALIGVHLNVTKALTQDGLLHMPACPFLARNCI